MSKMDVTSKSDLQIYFENNDKRLIHKWMHYFDIYERYFGQYRNKEVCILEIGVSQGGSLQMWKDYFGNRAKIYGIDINPKCKDLEEENIEIFIGSQRDKVFLKSVTDQIPSLDIIIDDGGHTMNQQKTSFKVLFEHVKQGGIYLCEDLCTSYWPEAGGGYKRNGTFIEYMKNRIDDVHAFHSRQFHFKVNDYTENIGAVHFYDGIVVVEKNKRLRPYHEMTGNQSFPSMSRKPGALKYVLISLRKLVSYIMSYLRIPTWK